MAVDLSEYSDIELFYQLQSDRKTADKAFTELYNRLSPRIYAYCRRFLGDDEEARDIFQETFVRFYKSAKEERNMTNVAAFLLRIARNQCFNARKHAKTTVSFEEYMVPAPDESSDKDELLNLVKMALDLLPVDYKEVFILREYEGLNYNDISELTNIPLATVKVRIHRAKQKIREILAPYLAEFTK